MSNQNINSYQPGMGKIVHHLEHLRKMQKGEIVAPIHISVFPNNVCNLNCPYCCFGKTERTDEELSLEDFKHAIDVLSKYGLKAVEISGIGEPLMWSHFIPAVNYVYAKGLKLSLVTNGLLLPTILQETLSKFNWIRVSVQSAEYARKINMSWIPNWVKKSMSYIVHNGYSFLELDNLYNFAKQTDTIIRVAPYRPCTPEYANSVINRVNQLGYPLIAFDKHQGEVKGCFFAWVRGAIDFKGNFLPCPSIELSPERAGKIPDDFPLCHVRDLESWLINNPAHDLGYRCSYCNCGFAQNNFIKDILTKGEDEEWV